MTGRDRLGHRSGTVSATPAHDIDARWVAAGAFILGCLWIGLIALILHHANAIDGWVR